jgi:hypothetical protein
LSLIPKACFWTVSREFAVAIVEEFRVEEFRVGELVVGKLGDMGLF